MQEGRWRFMGWFAWRGSVARAKESQAAVVHCTLSVVPEERDADLVRAVWFAVVCRYHVPCPFQDNDM